MSINLNKTKGDSFLPIRYNLNDDVVAFCETESL